MNPTVLIIDDDESVMRSLVRLVSAHGIRAHGQTDAGHVLRTALELRPTVVLIDLHMPHCSGIELAQQMRSESALTDARIVGMSATIPDWNDEALSAFDEVLAKPVLLEALMSAIRG